MLYRIVLTIQVRDDPDYTKHLARIGLFTGFEVWFTIIVACIPTLAPVARLASNRIKTLTSGSSAAGYDKTPVELRELSNGHSGSRRYHEIEGGSQTRLNVSCVEDHLSPHIPATTRIEFDTRNLPPNSMDPRSIQVQRDIECR